MKDQSDPPPSIGKPATRTLTGAGYPRPEDFPRATEAKLGSLLSVGAKPCASSAKP